MSMNGETSGNRIWKMTMLGIATQPSAPFCLRARAVLPHRLHDAEGPAEALPHQAVRGAGRLGIGQGAVLVIYPIARLQKRHGEIGVLGDGIRLVATGGAHGGGAPGADRAGHHADGIERVQRAPLEVLAGDVLQRLPARPQVHPIADLGVARHGGDLGIAEVRHQPAKSRRGRYQCRRRCRRRALRSRTPVRS